MCLHKWRLWFLVSCAISVFFLTGCATPNTIKKVDKLTGDVSTAKILLMPVDVELSQLTAAGLLEPQAEWTQDAMRFMENSLESRLQRAGYEFSVFDSPMDDHTSDKYQLQKLHEALGYSILRHHLGMYKLPTKKGGVFDWSIGKKAQILNQETAANYALFVFIRDSYSTGGRVAMQIGMALLGVGIAGGNQVGFASLVDLNSGDIVWFNFLARTTGDLREQSASNETIAELLSDFPGIERNQE